MADERSVLRGLLESLGSTSISSSDHLLTLLYDSLRLLLTSSDGTQLHVCLLQIPEDESPRKVARYMTEAGSSSHNQPRGAFKAWPADVDLGALRRRMLASAFIEDVQYLLLTRIAVTWADNLGEERWQRLLEAFFFPSLQDSAFQPVSRPSTLIQEVTSSKGKGKVPERSGAQSELLTAAASITCASFRSLTRFTSEASRRTSLVSGTAANLPPATFDAICHVSGFPARGDVSLPALYDGLAAEASRTRRKLLWEDVIKQWTALPTRIANATQGQAPESLQNDSMLATFAVAFESLVHSFADRPSLSDDEVSDLALCLSRLIRHGTVNLKPRSKAPRDMNPTFWGRILPLVSDRATAAKLSSSDEVFPQGYRRNWLKIIEEMVISDGSSFRRSLIAYLEHVWNLRDPPSDVAAAHGGPDLLLAYEEHTRKGAEGTVFLGSGRKGRAFATAAVLRLFFSRLSLSRPPFQWGKALIDYTSEDEEDLRDRFTTYVTELILPRSTMRSAFSGPSYGPSLSHSFAFWLQISSQGLSPEQRCKDIMALLEPALSLWGDPAAVKRFSLEQDTYFTALLLGLLAQLRNLAEAKQSPGFSNEADLALRRLTTLPPFSKGVASHLDHGDPETRRLGMLIAECITESASATRTATSEEGKHAKLDFGKSIWDGHGEGQEEARVLRAMFHAWPADGELVQLLDGKSIAEAMNVSTSRDSLQKALVKTVSPLRDVRNPGEAPHSKKQNEKPPKIDEIASMKDRTPISKSLISIIDAYPSQPKVGVLEPENEDKDLKTFSAHSNHASDEDESSSGSDSSADEDSEEAKLARDLEGNQDLPSAEAALKLPSEGKKRAPVYIMELRPLFLKNDRRSNRTALKHAEALIRKKAGWGGEVDENAADLACSISGLQNTFKIKKFNEMKTGALTALICASPHIAAGAVIEQFFNPQYSMEQRYLMLNAIAFASLQLAGETSDQSHGDVVTSIAKSLANDATAKAKADGESHVPAIQREKKLRLGKTSSALSSQTAGGMTSRTTFPGALVRPAAAYIDIAANTFLHPLVTRTWAHMQEAGARRGRTIGGYLGAGAGALFAPLLISRLLDTLSILAHAARNSAEYTNIITPELLELVLGVARDVVPLAAAHQLYNDGSQSEDASNTLQQSFASLALTVLSDVYARDSGQSLLRSHASLLSDIQELMQGIFEREDARGGKAAHPAAAVLLRIAEIRDTWQSSVI